MKTNKQKLKMIALMLATMSLNITAFAQGSSGSHGGNAVVCYEDATKKTIKSIELFDYWEMAQDTQEFGAGAKVDLGPDNLSTSGHINFATNRLGLYDYHRAEAYRKVGQDILSNIDSYLVDGDLPIIEDTHPRHLPVAPCYIEQFAVQLKNPSPNESRFIVSKRLYLNPLTSNAVRAGLILHETTYREFLENGETNSDHAREFNFVFSSNVLGQPNLNLYQEFLSKVHLNLLQTFPILVQTGDSERIFQLVPQTVVASDQNQGYSGELLNPMEFQMKDSDLKLAAGAKIYVEKLSKLTSSAPYYFCGVRQGYVSVDDAHVNLSYFGESPVIGAIQDGHFEFYPDGTIQFFNSTGALSAAIFGKEVQCQQYHGWETQQDRDWNYNFLDTHGTEFFENETIKSCYFVKAVSLPIGSVMANVVAIDLKDPNTIASGLIAQAEITLPVAGCNGSVTLVPGKTSASGDQARSIYINVNEKGELILPPLPNGPANNIDYTYSALKSPFTYSVNGQSLSVSSLEKIKLTGCTLSADLDFNFQNKQDRDQTKMLTLSPSYDSARINEYAQKFCLQEGVDSMTNVSISQRVIDQLFTQVYDIDTAQIREPAIDSKITNVSVTCRKTMKRGL